MKAVVVAVRNHQCQNCVPLLPRLETATTAQQEAERRTQHNLLLCPSRAEHSPATRVPPSAVKRSIGSTIGFHNHGEGPYYGLLLVESAYTMLINPPFPYDFCVATQFHVYLPWGQRQFSIVS